jgi:hypothetical protein
MSPKNRLPTSTEDVQEYDSYEKVLHIFEESLIGLSQSFLYQRENTGLWDFEILFDLPDETTITTTLVRSFVSGKLCIMKSLQKDSALKDSQGPYIWSEREILKILKNLKNPFLENLQSSFDDNENHYFVVVSVYATYLHSSFLCSRHHRITSSEAIFLHISLGMANFLLRVLLYMPARSLVTGHL